VSRACRAVDSGAILPAADLCASAGMPSMLQTNGRPSWLDIDLTWRALCGY